MSERKQIIEQAKAAGFSTGAAWNWILHLEQFARIVRNAERESCAETAEEEACECCGLTEAEKEMAQNIADQIRKRSNAELTGRAAAGREGQR